LDSHICLIMVCALVILKPMKNLRITPARKRFLEAFDQYTNKGTNPHTLDNAWKELGVQPRTINFCKRNGLLAKSGLPHTYVVAMEIRRMLNLALPPKPLRKKPVQPQKETVDVTVRRRTRRRSSSVAV